MYVAVKGGEKAIKNAHTLFAEKRRGNENVPGLRLDQITEQLSFAVDRVMGEGSLYDKELAAMAIRQAQGDLIEAIFLIRAYRTTLPRFGYAEPVETSKMAIERRISATFKDLPGGQILGPTFDYSHRLINFDFAADDAPETPPASEEEIDLNAEVPRVSDILGKSGMIEPDHQFDEGHETGDLTRTPIDFPTDRDVRLQNLARGDEGFLLALGYSTQRGYARSHPFAGEIRFGEVEVEFFAEELGFAVPIGTMDVTECQMINQFQGSAKAPPAFTRGYGLVFGQAERKAMSMALVDRALRWKELGEEFTAPAQDQEFVLSHSDNIQATGFVEHLKLPHYVDFQAELDLIRTMRKEFDAREKDTGDEKAPKMEAAQ